MSKNKKSLKEKLAIRRSKTILGHSPSPAIAKGVYAVGTSVRHNVMYNKWPAKWSNRHVIIGGDPFDGETLSVHDLPKHECNEIVNRRREAVMATRAKMR